MATIEQRGPYQWRAKVRRKGYPVQTKTHDYKAEAEAWARDIEAQMDRSAFVDRSLSERETLKDVIKVHLKKITPTHKGAESEKMRLNKFMRDEHELCAYAMANLRTEHFEDYRDRRLEQVKPGTVARELNLLHSVIQHCRRRLSLLENPISHVKRPKVRDARFSRLEDGDEDKLLTALDDCRNEFIKPAVILALETAMRRGELLSLKWDDVDLAKQTATLHDTKNGDTRIVPLSTRAAAVFQQLLVSREKKKVVGIKRDRRVFPISDQSLKCAWERGRTRADMEHFTFHDLRHEAISRLFERGWDAIKVAAVSGHRNMQSLKRYANFKAENLAKELG